jgi:hypothetical protein
MRLTPVIGLALALAAVPDRLVAQAGDSHAIAPGQEALTAAAQLRLPAASLSQVERPAGGLIAQQARASKREGEILMIVGAAGIVTGLLTDEDLITIAGAVVGGVGLYFYLQATR